MKRLVRPQPQAPAPKVNPWPKRERTTPTCDSIHPRNRAYVDLDDSDRNRMIWDNRTAHNDDLRLDANEE